MTEKRGFNDFTPGEVFEYGDYAVTEDEIIAFAKQYDPQPFHVDPEAAKSSIYGGLIASGWMTCGIAMRLVADNLLAHTLSQGSPGVDQLRWLKPVRPGDRLRVRIIIGAVTPSRSKPDRGTVDEVWEVLNQTDEVVMVASSKGMFGRRG